MWKNFRFDEKTFFWIVIAIVAFTRLRLANIAMERDEGEYAYAAMQILKGGLPYRDFYNMKFPGVYYVYALVFAAFGQTIAAVRVLVLLLNFATAFFTFQIAKKWLGEKSAWLASAFYLLFAVSNQAQGFVANCEHFVVTFATLGIWLTLEKRCFWAGIALGISCLMKQHAAVFALLSGLYLLKDFFEKGIAWQFVVARILRLIVGFAVPILALWAWVEYHHLSAPFSFFTIEYAAAYAKIMPPTTKYLSNWRSIAYNSLFFWACSLAGLYGVFARSRADKQVTWIGIWWILSFVAVSAGWYFRPHYFQMLFPAAALLAAYGLCLIPRFSIGNVGFAMPHLLAFGLLVTVVPQFSYFFYKTPEKIMGKLYRGEHFEEIRTIGHILREQIPENESFAQYGCEPQLAFYAQRTMASGYLYSYPLLEKQPYAPRMAAQFIAETEAKNPNWLVYSSISKGEENVQTLKTLNDWWATKTQNYQLRGCLYETNPNASRWIWDNTTKIATIDSCQILLLVYQKKALLLSQ